MKISFTGGSVYSILPSSSTRYMRITLIMCFGMELQKGLTLLASASISNLERFLHYLLTSPILADRTIMIASISEEKFCVDLILNDSRPL